MSVQWIAIAQLYPMAGAAAAMVPRVPAGLVRFWMATLGLPALAVGLLVPTGATLTVDSLLMGGALGLRSDTARLFLLVTAGLWTLAGLFAWPYTAGDRRVRSYGVFTLLSYTGNIGIFLATDLAFFYSSFALMTFSAYGLVVHTRKPEAVRAGTLYIGMAVFGEVLVLTGLLWLAREAGTLSLADLPAAGAASPHTGVLVALLLFGFGVKAGLLPVHVWLPLAHPVAPTPASAVLSGAMIKAGLFGWLTFLPGGAADFPGWGSACIAFGLAGAFGAAYAGFTQDHPKATLAYSSISQMGVMTIALGIGLASAKAWPVAVGLLAFYACSHALAKGALFMAVGAAHAAHTALARRIVVAGSIAAGLVIAGAPFTGGALAKNALKKLGAYAPDPWSGLLGGLLLLSALATTLLLARFVQLNLRAAAHGHEPGDARTDAGLLWTWGLSLAACLILPWGAAAGFDTPVKPVLPDLKTLLKAWPVALGIALAFPLLARVGRLPVVPMGDVGLLILRLGRILGTGWSEHIAPLMEQKPITSDHWLHRLIPPEGHADEWPDALDRGTRLLPVAGIMALGLVLALYWTLQ